MADLANVLKEGMIVYLTFNDCIHTLYLIIKIVRTNYGEFDYAYTYPPINKQYDYFENTNSDYVKIICG